MWGWFQAQQPADSGAYEEFAAGEAGDGIARESEHECGVCGSLANAGPEWFAWFEAYAVEELCDLGACKCCRDEIKNAHRDTAGKEQDVGGQSVVNGAVEVGRGVSGGLKAEDTGSHVLQECGQHGLAGVAELALWRSLVEGDEFISGGDDGHGGDGCDGGVSDAEFGECCDVSWLEFGAFINQGVAGHTE
ncbi:MAG: hypothetical protein RLZZ458_2558 [Planctomycetota bacterium]